MEEGADADYSYHVSLALDMHSTSSACLSLIKKRPNFLLDQPIKSQLQLIMLPGPAEVENPYETILSYLHNAVSPYFEALTCQKEHSAKKGQEDDSKSGEFSV